MNSSIRQVGGLQVELLLPHRIEVAINGLGPLLGLAHLNSDIRITGPCLVLCLKSLGTNNYCSDRQRRKESVKDTLASTQITFSD